MEQRNLQPKPKPKQEEGCKVKFKRDRNGRVIGFEAKGKCTKEHLKLAQGSVENSSSEEED